MSDNCDRNIWDAIGSIDETNDGDLPNGHTADESSTVVDDKDKDDSTDKTKADINGNEEEKTNRALMIPSLNSLRDKLGFRSKEKERKQAIMKPATVRSQESDATTTTPVNRYKSPRSPENIFDKAFGFMKAVKPVLQGSGTGSPSPSPTTTTESNRSSISGPVVNGDSPAPATMETVQPLDLSKASRTIKVPKQFKKSSTTSNSGEEVESGSGDSPLDLSFKKRPGDAIVEGPPVKKLGVEVMDMPSTSGTTSKAKTECLAKPSSHRTSIFPKPAHTNSDSFRRQSGVHGGSAPPPVLTALPFRTTPRWNAALPGNANHEPVIKAVKVSPVRPHIKGKPVYGVNETEQKNKSTLSVASCSEAGETRADSIHPVIKSCSSASTSSPAITLKEASPPIVRVAMHNLPVQCIQATNRTLGQALPRVSAVGETNSSNIKREIPLVPGNHKVTIREGKVTQYSIQSCQTKPAVKKGLMKKPSPSKPTEAKTPPTLLNVPVFKPLERKPAKSPKTAGLSGPMKAVAPVSMTFATATATVTTTNMVTSVSSSVAETVVAFSSPVMSSTMVVTSDPTHRLTLSELTQKLAVQLKTALPAESSSSASQTPSSSSSGTISPCTPVDSAASVSKTLPVIQKPASPLPNTAMSNLPKVSDVAKSDLPIVADKSNDLQTKPIKPPSIPVIGQGPIMAARKSTAKPTRLPFMCARKSTALPQKAAKKAAKLQRLKSESMRESPPRLMVVSPERTLAPTPPLLPSPPMPLLSPSTPVSKTSTVAIPETSQPLLTEVCERAPAREDPVHSTDSAGSTPAHDNSDSDACFKPASSAGLYHTLMKQKGPIHIPTNDAAAHDESDTSSDDSSPLPSFNDNKRTISKFTLSILESGKPSNKDSSVNELRISKLKSTSSKDIVKPGSPRRRPIAMHRKKPDLHVPDLSPYSRIPMSKLPAFMPTRRADLSPISWSVVSTTCSLKDAIVTLTQAKTVLPTTDITSTRYYQTTILKQCGSGDRTSSPSPLTPLSITIPPNQISEPNCPAVKKPTIKSRAGLPIVAKDWKESTCKYKKDVLLMPKKLIYVPRKTPKGFRSAFLPVPAQLKKKTSSINKLITKFSREAFRKAKREARKSLSSNEGVIVHKKKRKRKKKLNVDVASAKAAAVRDDEAARKAYSIVPSPDGSSTKITIIHSPVSAGIISPMSSSFTPEIRKVKNCDEPSTSGLELLRLDSPKATKKPKQKDTIKKFKASTPTTHIAELSQSDAHVVPKITIKTSPRATSPRGGDFDITLGSPRQTSPRQSSPRSVWTPSAGTTTEACTTLIHDISPESSSPCPKVKITFKTVPKTSPNGGEPQKNHPPTPKVTIRTGPLRKDPEIPQTPVSSVQKDAEITRKDVEKCPPQKLPDVTRKDIEIKIKSITRRDIEMGLLNASLAGSKKETADEKISKDSEKKPIVLSSEEESSQQDAIMPSESGDVNQVVVKDGNPDKNMEVDNRKAETTSFGKPNCDIAADVKPGKKAKSKKLSSEAKNIPKVMSQQTNNWRSRSPIKRKGSKSSIKSGSRSRERSLNSEGSISLSKSAKLQRKLSQSSMKSVGKKSHSLSGSVKSVDRKVKSSKKAGRSRSSSCASRSRSPQRRRSRSPPKKSQSKSPSKVCKSRKASPGKRSRSSSKQSRTSSKHSRSGSLDSRRNRSMSYDSRRNRSCSISSTKSDETVKSEDFNTPKNKRETARERAEREERKRRKKRSLLDELVNSKGYIADKCDRRSDTLWADPNKLTREERALQRAMLQFTKMELGVEVQGRGKTGPGSQLSPISSISSVSSTTSSPEALVSPKSNNSSSRTPETPKSSNMQTPSGSRSLASMKAKSLKDRALKRSRDDKRSRRRSISPKKSTFEDFKPTILGSRTRRQAQGEHFEGSHDDSASRLSESSDGATPGTSGFSPYDRSKSKMSGRENRRRCVASLSYRDYDEEEDFEDIDNEEDPESSESSPTNSAKKRSKSVHMKLVQKAANMARDVMKKKWQKSHREKRKLEEKRKVLAAQDNPWAADYEDMVYDLPHGDQTLEVIDSASQAGSNSSSLDLVPPEVKKISVVRETGENVLHKAARLGYKEATLWCCENKYVNLNSKDHAGYAPLHEASTTGNVTIAKYLIAYGAEVDVGSLDGVRPLHDAVENNHFEMVRLLLSCGADIHLATYSGKKVLDLARTPEMKALIEGYLADMNGTANNEANIQPWELPQITPPPEESSDEEEVEKREPDLMESCGYDIFADIPSDDDIDCVDVEFQFSSRPHLSSYYIRASRDDIPRNYVLLRDVVERLGVTRQDLVSAHPGLYVINLSINAFLCAVNSSQLCYRSKHLTLEPRHNSIELVELDATLHDILDVDIVTIRDHRRHRRKRKSRKKRVSSSFERDDDQTTELDESMELDTTTELDLSGETIEGVSYEERFAAGPGDLVPGYTRDPEMVNNNEDIEEKSDSTSLLDDLVIDQPIQRSVDYNETGNSGSVNQTNEAAETSTESDAQQQGQADMGMETAQTAVSADVEYPTDNTDYFMNQDNNATDEDNIYVDEGSQKDGDDIDVEIISDTESPVPKVKLSETVHIPAAAPVNETEIVEIPDSPPRPVETKAVIHKPKQDSPKVKLKVSPEKRDKQKRDKNKRSEGPKTIQLRPSRLDHLDRQRLTDDKRTQDSRFQMMERPFQIRDEERPAFTFPSLHVLPGTSMYSASDLSRMLYTSATTYSTTFTPSPSIHTVSTLHPSAMYPTLPLHRQLHSPLSSLHYPRTNDMSVPMPLAPPSAATTPVMSFLPRPYISDSQPTYIPHDVTSYLLPPPSFPTPPMLQPSAPVPVSAADKAPVQLQILDIASLAQHSATHPGMHHLGH